MSTSDFGETWTWSAITENSPSDNLRPVVAKWNGQNTALAWLQGTYTTYTNWSTEVVGLSFASTGPKSLLWRGDAASPNTWDINSTMNWDSGGDLIDPFKNGDEVAFDDTASSYMVQLATAVAPMGVAFNNAFASYTVSGAGIGGAARLRVIGGGAVTLANAANSYTGETTIARGTLAISGGATISGTPHIHVMSGGTFDVTSVAGSAYTLNNQALTIDGNVNGNLTANDSLVTGAGIVNGSLTTQAGTIVQVGGNMQAKSIFTYLDATHGVGGNTTLSNGSIFTPTTNPDWQIRGTGNGTDGPLGNNGRVYQGSSENPASAPELRTTISGLNPGHSYVVYVNYWDASGSTFRILAGATSGSLTLFDSPLDNVVGATNGVDPKTFEYVTAPMTSEGNRLMWGAALGELVADANGEIKVYVNDTGTNDGDDRTWYDGLSYSTGLSYSGQATLTVNGDFVMDNSATLTVNIGDPAHHDRLVVTGTATFAGTIDVVLAENGLPPQIGDTFDILDFTSSSGAFDAFNLPSLDAHLAWNINKLHTTGVLEVVESGDYNGNGVVDAADYVVWRMTPNSFGGDPNGYNAWRGNYGEPADNGSGSIANAAVLEPTTLILFILAAICWCVRRGPHV